MKLCLYNYQRNHVYNYSIRSVSYNKQGLCDEMANNEEIVK